MSIKKKLGMGVASAALGIALVGGGTFAYFSDVEATNNTFAAGTLDLAVDPTSIINVENIKPGDKMFRNFKLKNGGTLDIGAVDLITSYEVVDAKGDNGGEDFGKHIRVNFMHNASNDSIPIWSTTLAELKEISPDLLREKVESVFKKGIKAGEENRLYVQFEFVDNGQDQNIFQGDKLELKWTFDAKQTKGENK
ncbi:CalY family protein [Siminovitchia fortis]|uniref:Cell division protein FtsN n=1 Tax=Siminovitchia fortis TaxID=254758 RepID=A0A443J3L8_9BACI|nr:CalY family protein [Siminovitchia fortis]RWR15040.1 cell division protein FtsN [Siminovitchia fortis]WHY82822.1 CalY family protein [Siminovitchia fortis]